MYASAGLSLPGSVRGEGKALRAPFVIAPLEQPALGPRALGSQRSVTCSSRVGPALGSRHPFLAEHLFQFRIFVAQAPGSPAVLEGRLAMLAMGFEPAALDHSERGPAAGQWCPPDADDSLVRHEDLAARKTNHFQASAEFGHASGGQRTSIHSADIHGGR